MSLSSFEFINVVDPRSEFHDNGKIVGEKFFNRILLLKRILGFYTRGSWAYSRCQLDSDRSYIGPHRIQGK